MTDKKLYETAMLAISMLSGDDLTAEGSRKQEILLDYLPYYWAEDDRVYAAAAILTGEGPEKWTDFSGRTQEVQESIQQIENSHTDEEWDDAMCDFGVLCLDELIAIYTEELCD